MQYSLVQFKDIEKVETLRIDAEYFKPEYLKIENVINNNSQRFTDLQKLHLKIDASAFYPSLEPHYNTGNLPFLRVSNIDKFIDYKNAVKIPEEILPEFPTLKTINKGDIVVTKGGSVARVGLVDRKSAASRDLVFFNSSTLDEVEHTFLFVYFLTDIYQKLLIRSSSMTAQPHLTLTLVKKISIFTPSRSFKEKIYHLYTKAYDSLNTSFNKYSQAVELFLSKLNLTDWKPTPKLSYIKSFSKTQKSDRIDAEYHQPKYDEIITQLSKHQLSSISKEFIIIKGKNLKYIDSSDVGVIKTKQLSHRFINFKIESTTSNEILSSNKLTTIQNKDVLFASMGVGSLGKTNIFYEYEGVNYDRFTIDSTLRIFRKKARAKVKPEVLAVYLSSLIGQELIYKNVVGSSGIISIYENYLSNFVLPVLKQSLQDEISQKVQEAHYSKFNSKLLIELARKTVENAIETDENNALNQLNQKLRSLQIQV